MNHFSRIIEDHAHSNLSALRYNLSGCIFSFETDPPPQKKNWNLGIRVMKGKRPVSYNLFMMINWVLSVVFLFFSFFFLSYILIVPLYFSSRTKEVNFVVVLIRDRFNDVIQIGRDLVRLLQNVARIPEIEQVDDTSIYTYIYIILFS